MGEEIVIVAAKRTAVGKYGGALKDISAPVLTTTVMKDLIKDIDPGIINDVIWGCCYQKSKDETNMARVAALKAGIPVTVPGVTVHRTCTSALTALIMGSQAIKAGDAEVILAGGTESMSTVPYTLESLRWGARMGHVEIRDNMWDGLTRLGTGLGMGMTAENLAEIYNIPREEQDLIAYNSHMRAAKAIAEGKLKDQIVPVEIPGRKGPVIFDTDEGPRGDTTLEGLAKLKPAFGKKDGTVTAGNASTINDGAAGVLIMTESKAKSLGLKPMARLVSYAVAGVEPDIMGIGPVPASKMALAKANLKLEEVDLFEVNEAFAAQYLAVERELKLNRDITNVNGSGISMGHPVGAAGARILVMLLYEMARRNSRYGLATLCSGGGMGVAVIVERS